MTTSLIQKQQKIEHNLEAENQLTVRLLEYPVKVNHTSVSPKCYERSITNLSMKDGLTLLDRIQEFTVELSAIHTDLTVGLRELARMTEHMKQSLRKGHETVIDNSKFTYSVLLHANRLTQIRETEEDKDSEASAKVDDLRSEYLKMTIEMKDEISVMLLNLMDEIEMVSIIGKESSVGILGTIKLIKDIHNLVDKLTDQLKKIMCHSMKSEIASPLDIVMDKEG